MAAHVRPHALILGLQNGVDNATRLTEQFRQNVERKPPNQCRSVRALH